MTETYEYMPDDFKQKMPSLSEDLHEFYDAFELYKNTNDDLDEISLKEKFANLLLTIKHRKLNGIITEEYGTEMEIYLEDFLND